MGFDCSKQGWTRNAYSGFLFGDLVLGPPSNVGLGARPHPGVSRVRTRKFLLGRASLGGTTLGDIARMLHRSLRFGLDPVNP